MVKGPLPLAPVLLLAALIFRVPELRSLEEPRSIFTTQIGPGLKIVTEVSVRSPYLGQQFSILYSLVAQRYPAAIDIQPQQYSGLWSEIVPLPEQTRTVTRFVRGRPTHEFLLRQVIAFPVEEGTLILPPLAVKIMMGGSVDPRARGWDFESLSDPVPLSVRPLPASGPASSPPLLVGTLACRLDAGGRSQGREVLLELEGTANLAFFQPLDWLRGEGLVFLPPRLVKAESVVETWDTGERRHLILRQRRQWAIKILSSDTRRAQVEDMAIPVFDPERGAWSETQVRGLVVQMPPANSPARAPTPGSEGLWAGYVKHYGLPALIVGVAAVVAFGAGWLSWRRRKKPGPRRTTVNLEKLERQSHRAPRSFLETAHRLLERFAEDHHRTPGAGTEDEPFNQCWSEIERCRFDGGEPPADVRRRILELLQAVLSEQERSRPGNQQESQPWR